MLPNGLVEMHAYTVTGVAEVRTSSIRQTNSNVVYSFTLILHLADAFMQSDFLKGACESFIIQRHPHSPWTLNSGSEFHLRTERHL